MSESRFAPSAEDQFKSAHEKKKVAQGAISGGLPDALRTGQVSAYHTEGETVRSHYRLIFDSLHAITGESSPERIEKLPTPVREAIRELDPSVIDTCKTYPNLLRAVVLFHDIAKTEQNSNINITEMVIPSDTSAEDAEVLAAMRSAILTEKTMKEKVEKLKKAMRGSDKETDIKLKTELESAQASAEAAQETKYVTYRALRQKYSSTGMYAKFKVGVGFQAHEKLSADIVRMTDLDSEIKTILSTIVEDHIIPLVKFDEELDPRKCAKRYRQAYSSYTDLEFKLSVAMASLDILGSIPADGHTDLRAVKNILLGKREAWIEDHVAEEKKLLLAERLKGLELSATDFNAGTEEEKIAIVNVRKLRKKIEDQVEKELRQKYEAAYSAQ